MRTAVELGSVLFLVALLSNVSCSSDSESSPCDDVCDCVREAGGDGRTCLSECKKGAATSDVCRATLASYGFSSCNSHCDAFGGGAGGAGGPGGAGGGPVGGGGEAGSGQAGSGAAPPGGQAGNGGGGGPTGGQGGVAGQAGMGGSAGAPAYTLTPCAGATVTPGITASFPQCNAICPAAHCVPTNLAGPHAAELADCPDATSKCIPDAIADTNGRFVFKRCTSSLDPNGQGRCVPRCFPATQVATLEPADCGPNEVCAPCIDALTGAPTSACIDYCAGT